ncbi:MAG TPA: SBBP repeat-containing protein, partial [Planctomycetota bacterium]|nr:SBBP repeat-containing protein [Planctomycetota bacterium]
MASAGLGRIAVLAAGAVLGLQAGGRTDDALAPPPTRAPDAAPSPRSVPWEPNRGQAPEGVLAIGRGGGVTALVGTRGARLLVPGGAVAMEIRGAGGGRAALGRRLPGRSNYFLGSDRERWIPRVPHHASVAVRGARGAASIDWTSRSGRPAYDLHLPAGTDPAAIEVRFDGAGALSIASDGSLEVPAGDGRVVHSAPVAWQESAGRRTPVAARWAIRGPGRAGFAVGARDASLPLVIDPEIRFVRLLGGSGQEQALKMAFDGQGRLLLAGATASTNYPIVDPIQGAYAGGLSDAFVSALDPEDGTLLWSTYLGGARTDACTAVASDGAGVVVAGMTNSSDFPTLGAFDSSLEYNNVQGVGAGIWDDGFVTRLTAAGDALEWSTYIGGDGERDFLTGLGIAPDGSIRICGGTSDFQQAVDAPLIVNATTTLGTPKWQAHWVAALPADGSAIEWLLAIGYVPSYSLAGLAVAPDGDTLVVGSGWSTTYVENALQPVAGNPTNYEGWVARVKPDGSGVRWATFLGGAGADYPASVAVDAAGDVYVAGTTDSANFPVTENAFDRTYAGNKDCFVS